MSNIISITLDFPNDTEGNYIDYRVGQMDKKTGLLVTKIMESGFFCRDNATHIFYSIFSEKIKTPREIILECCKGSKNATEFFKKLSDDAFIGYQTAMIKILNPNIEMSTEELFTLISNMVKNKEL